MVARECKAEILFKEFERVRRKALMVDQFFFQLMAVAIVPFFIFLGYCAVNPRFRPMLAALPFLTTCGLFVTVLLANHYLYAGFYGNYLEERLNSVIGSKELQDSAFGRIFYDGPASVVFVGHLLSIVLLVILNLAAYPIIEGERLELSLKFLRRFKHSSPFLDHYWLVAVGFFLAMALLSGLCWVRSVRKAGVLVTTLMAIHRETATTSR